MRATRSRSRPPFEAQSPGLADLAVNCVNVPGTELASILCASDEGTVYFFSMNTSFTAAALGAEGAGKDVTMIVGNGFAKGHADIALQTLRDHPPRRRLLCATLRPPPGLKGFGSMDTIARHTTSNRRFDPADSRIGTSGKASSGARFPAYAGDRRGDVSRIILAGPPSVKTPGRTLRDDRPGWFDVVLRRRARAVSSTRRWRCAFRPT